MTRPRALDDVAAAATIRVTYSSAICPDSGRLLPRVDVNFITRRTIDTEDRSIVLAAQTRARTKESECRARGQRGRRRWYLRRNPAKSIFRFAQKMQSLSSLCGLHTTRKKVKNPAIQAVRERCASKGRFIYERPGRAHGTRRHSKRQYLNIVKSRDTCQRQTRRSYLYSGSWPARALPP